MANKWIEDSKTSELYSESQRKFRIFNRESFSGTKRFIELEKYIIRTYPTIINPEFKASNLNTITIKKSAKNLNIEVGNIIENFNLFFKSYYGDLKSFDSLLSRLIANISSTTEQNNENNNIYQEIEDNKFIFLKIVNKSSMKSSSISCICQCDKYNVDINIDIHEIQTLNRSANILCREIVNKKAMDNIDLIKQFSLESA